MRLQWSRLAYQDRDAIFDYIEAENPSAAIRVDNAIADQAAQLIDFPLSGRTGRVPGTREGVVTGLPYILVYEVGDLTIRILRVLHAARQWPL